MSTTLTLARKILGDKATLGDLAINGVFECHTLEDVVREVAGNPVSAWKIAGATAIPAGTYQVVIDFSPHFGRIMPHLLSVPGFDGIRIHSGNTDADTEGCILLGQYETSPDFIGSSRAAFDAFFPKLQDAVEQGEVYIVITNPTPGATE